MRSLLTRGGEDGGSNTIEPNRHGFSLRPTGLNCHLVKAEPDGRKRKSKTLERADSSSRKSKGGKVRGNFMVQVIINTNSNR